MTDRPDIVQVVASDNRCLSKNRASQAAFIIREVNRFGGLLNSFDFLKASQLGTGHVLQAAKLPGIHHITDQLLLIGITGAGINLNAILLVSGGFVATESGNIYLPPVRGVAASDYAIVISVHQHREPHLL